MSIYRLKRTIVPQFEPVTLTEAKTHCVVDSDFTDDDAYLTALIKQARIKLEGDTGIALVEQTWEMVGPCFLDDIEIPRPPLSELTSIKYYDTAGALQTLSADVYRVVDHGIKAMVERVDGQSWPSLQVNRLDAVKITFVAGVYGGNGGSPEALDTATASYMADEFDLAKLAIQILVAHWYEFREPVVAGVSLANVPASYEDIANLLRVNWL